MAIFVGSTYLGSQNQSFERHHKDSGSSLDFVQRLIGQIPINALYESNVTLLIGKLFLATNYQNVLDELKRPLTQTQRTPSKIGDFLQDFARRRSQVNPKKKLEANHGTI
jgi:hypothetical protein